MTENMIEDELEATGRMGSGEIWIACLCLGLSILCCLLWVGLLIAPQLLHASKAV